MKNIVGKLRILKLKYFNRSYYQNYIKVQSDRSQEKLKTKVSEDIERKKKETLTGLLSSHVDLSKINNGLVVGCRNDYELDLLLDKGVKNITGVDLFSVNSRIVIMDMHHLKFKDNTFDLVYASHVLEHSYDINQVAQQLSRVSTDNVYFLIEIPINYPTNNIDLIDLKSEKAVIDIFKKFFNKIDVIVAEAVPPNTETNMDNYTVARVIFKGYK